MTLGEWAYNAYCDHRSWKSVRGEALPKFEDQTEDLKEAWEYAAKAVKTSVILECVDKVKEALYKL